MKRTKSSHRWLKEHVADPFVQRAQREGFRSRAVYKLKEILEKDQIVKPGMYVIDLGAAPGGWSEVVAPLVGKQGKVIALDILPIEPLEGVEIIQGDFTEQQTLDQLLDSLGHSKVNLVLSDMAPNMSGNKLVDQPRAMYLAELCLDLSTRVLADGGCMLVKLFQGVGIDDYVKQVRQVFSVVSRRKPQASRARSNEVYLLASGYNH